MSDAMNTKEDQPSFLKGLWHTAITIIGGVKPFLDHLREDLDKGLIHYALEIEKRVMTLILRGTALLFSIFLLGFGILFVLMDYTGLSRGIACLICGFLGLVVLMLSFKFTK